MDTLKIGSWRKKKNVLFLFQKRKFLKICEYNMKKRAYLCSFELVQIILLIFFLLSVLKRIIIDE